MKKTSIAVVFFVVVLSIAVLDVQAITISPWAGIADLPIREANSDLRYASRTPGSTLNSRVEFSTGMCAGLELGGIRVEAIMPVTASIEWTTSGGLVNQRSLTCDLQSAMLGFRIPHPGGSIMSIGIYAGYGQTTVTDKWQFDVNNPTPPDPITITAKGADVMGQAIFSIKLIFIEISASYRYAIIKQVLVDRPVLANDGTTIIYNTGDPLKTSATTGVASELDIGNGGKPLVFDYSGVSITAGFRFGPGPKKPQPQPMTIQDFYNFFQVPEKRR